MKPKAPTVDKTAILSKLTTFSQVSIVLLALALFTSAANAASPLNPLTTVYVVSLDLNCSQAQTEGIPCGQFGRVDLVTGSFTQIVDLPYTVTNLVWLNGSLYTLATADPYAGYLMKIDLQSNTVKPVGPTGLSYNAFALGEVNGKLYVTDFSNNIYTVNPHNGAAKLLNNDTGIPADPEVPFTYNSDGTFNLCDESLYGIGGSLYATFDSFNVDPVTLAINVNLPANPTLYRINPKTGGATPIGPTDLGIGATVVLDGIVFAFESPVTGFEGIPISDNIELVTLNLANGKTKFVRSIDPAVGPIFGAAPLFPFL